jgi:hypothetical protein
MVLSCQSTARKSEGPTILISEPELKMKVDIMASNFISQIEIDAMRISGETRNNEVRRRALYMKMKTITAIENATDHPKSLVSYMDLWALAYQMERFLENRHKEIGDKPELEEGVLGLFPIYRKMREEFESVAETFIPPESWDTTVKSLEKYVESYAIDGSGGSVTRVNFSDTAVGGLLSPVFDMTMSPFRALEGVGKAGEATEDIVTVSKRITRIVERLPEHLGWEMEGLLLDIRRDVDEILESIDEKQGSIQGTLKEVQASLATIDSVAARAEVIAASVDNTVTTLDSTAGSIERLLNTYKDTMMTLYPPKTPEEEAREAVEKAAAPEEDAKPFDITEYTASLAELTTASAELKGLLVEVRSTLEGDSFERVVKGAGEITSVALAESTQSLDKVIDNVTRRIIQILFIAFGLAVVFLILSRWVIRRKAA